MLRSSRGGLISDGRRQSGLELLGEKEEEICAINRKGNSSLGFLYTVILPVRIPFWNGFSNETCLTFLYKSRRPLATKYQPRSRRRHCCSAYAVTLPRSSPAGLQHASVAEVYRPPLHPRSQLLASPEVHGHTKCKSISRVLSQSSHPQLQLPLPLASSTFSSPHLANWIAYFHPGWCTLPL
jgi:hypothetical protein